MIRRIGNSGILDLGRHGMATFEIGATTKIAQNGILPLFNNRLWESQPVIIGGFKVVPHGESNNLPIDLRDIFDDNNLAEGIFKRQRGLYWGQGPVLFTEDIEENEKIRKLVKDNEVQDWLDGWDYEEYLRRCIVDYTHVEGVYSKFYKNKGSRIGFAPKIVKLEHVSGAKARLEWPEDGINYKNIIVGDWNVQDVTTLKPYPVFQKADPFANAVTMSYSNMYSFARDFYGVPSYYGSRFWINLASSIAKILMNYNVNASAITLHITSPASYWEAKEEKLKENCSLKGVAYNDKMLEDLKDATFKKFSETVTGVDNVGKFMSTESYFNPEANDFEGWKIDILDHKVKDYVDSQIAIANKADSATTSGLGLHPSLSNIMVDGKLASGSEQLYALKLFLATEIDIPEGIITKAINNAIAVNFPGKKVKIGFYHNVVKTEDNVSPQKRVKNVV